MREDGHDGRIKIGLPSVKGEIDCVVVEQIEEVTGGERKRRRTKDHSYKRRKHRPGSQ